MLNNNGFSKTIIYIYIYVFLSGISNGRKERREVFCRGHRFLMERTQSGFPAVSCPSFASIIVPLAPQKRRSLSACRPAAILCTALMETSSGVATRQAETRDFTVRDASRGASTAFFHFRSSSLGEIFTEFTRRTRQTVRRIRAYPRSTLITRG